MIAACDIKDSVGILDSYFPDAKFFLKRKHFEDYLADHKADYMSICVPNKEHKNYLFLAESLNIEAICEKPLVTKMEDYYPISEDVNIIQQLRLHPDIHKIKGDRIKIVYHTPRGDWYFKSWKGKENLLINIGIHLFDLMYYLFGKLDNHKIEKLTDREAKGFFTAGDKEVEYNLSINGRLIREVNGVNFTNIDLHTKSYEEILKGNGFKKQTVKPVLEFLEKDLGLLYN